MSKLDIMGVAEIAKRLGKDRDGVYVLHQRGKLPPADAIIGDGRTKVWRTSTIEKWISKEER